MYDLIIIGAGPAGLSASIYAARYKLRFLLIGKSSLSAITKSDKVENYPGVKSIKGSELIQSWKEQVENLGAKIVDDTVVNLEKKDNFFKVFLGNGDVFMCKNIILATGTVKNKLNVDGEAEFSGKGVSYCATCDAPFFKNKTVAVAGGGDSAAKASLHLASFAKKIFIIYRGSRMRAEPFWLEKIRVESKIEIIYNTNITKIEGTKVVEKIILDLLPYNFLSENSYQNKNELLVDGIFVEIGANPNSNLGKVLEVEVDEDGYIKVKADGSTNISGIYAVGDVTNGSNKLQQIVTAAAEGALAAASVYWRATGGGSLE